MLRIRFLRVILSFMYPPCPRVCYTQWCDILSRHAWWLIRRPFLLEALSSSVQDWLSIHWCRDIDMKFIELHIIESVVAAARFPKSPIIGYWNVISVFTKGEDPLTLELSSSVCWIQSAAFLANINGNALLGLYLKSWRHGSYTRCACRGGSLCRTYGMETHMCRVSAHWQTGEESCCTGWSACDCCPHTRR